MSLTRLLTKSSTITYRTQDDATTDEYGNPTYDTSSATVLCYFEPFSLSGRVQSQEVTLDRATTNDEWLYVVPADTDLNSVDSVAIDGESGTFELAGEPVHYWNPRRASTGQVEARLRRSQR